MAHARLPAPSIPRQGRAIWILAIAVAAVGAIGGLFLFASEEAPSTATRTPASAERARTVRAVEHEAPEQIEERAVIEAPSPSPPSAPSAPSGLDLFHRG